MKTALIGYTGFVGSNLLQDYEFQDLYNSKNIATIKGKEYDLVICSGVSGNMTFANQNPNYDLKNITDLFNHIRSAHIKKLVLISSTAVYSQDEIKTNENNKNYETVFPYGKNRRYLEEKVINNYDNYNIVRLPALFGKNLKKNLINDILYKEPVFISVVKFDKLLTKLSDIEKNILNDCYTLDIDRNIRLIHKESPSFDKLLPIFQRINFTSLQFTNSESAYQFYNLSHLWDDINIMINNNILELNISSEPIKAKEVVKLLINEDFNNKTDTIFNYDMQTIHAKLWNQDNDNYLYSKKQIKKELLSFYKQYRR